MAAQTRRQKASKEVAKVLSKRELGVPTDQAAVIAQLLGLLVVEVAALTDAFEGVQ